MAEQSVKIAKMARSEPREDPSSDSNMMNNWTRQEKTKSAQKQ